MDLVEDLVERLKAQHLLLNANNSPSEEININMDIQRLDSQRRPRDVQLLNHTEDEDSGMASDDDSHALSPDIHFRDFINPTWNSSTAPSESCDLLQDIPSYVGHTCHRCLESDVRTVTPSSVYVINSAPSCVTLPTSAANCEPYSPNSRTVLTDASIGNGRVVTSSSCSQFSCRLDDHPSCFRRCCSVNYLHDSRCHDDIDDEVQEILLPTECPLTSSCQLAESSYTNNGTFNCSTWNIRQRQEEGHSYNIRVNSTQRPSLNLYKMRKMRIRRKRNRKMSLPQHKLRPLASSVTISSSNVHHYLSECQETSAAAAISAPAYHFRSLALLSVA